MKLYMTMAQLQALTQDQISCFTNVLGYEIAIKQEQTKKVKDTPFLKKDGTTVMTTAAQAAQWEKYRNSASSLEQAKAATAAFKWTPALDAAIKANPAITTREIHELGGKGCQREMLKARKRELGVR